MDKNKIVCVYTCLHLRERLHKGAHVAIYMVAYKNSCLCCISCILEGKFSKEFQMRSLATKPCTAPQLQANSPPLKKLHLYTRGQVDLKIMLLTLHEKHKKKCFIRSMGSIISVFATPPQRNEHFFWAKTPQRGVRNGKI